MLIAGRGIPKNSDMGLNMLVDGYRNAFARFCQGEYDCMLASYAVRMGDACRDGLLTQ